MRLIVLAGLVASEKIELTQALARHYAAQGQRVTVLDHVSRLPLDPGGLRGAAYRRINGALEAVLPELLESLHSEIVLLAASETISPDALFTLLDALRDQDPALEITTLALLDTRTCDCFPNLRVSLETYADYSVYLPVEVGAVLEVLA
jgi:hypothetical protein